MALLHEQFIHEVNCLPLVHQVGGCPFQGGRHKKIQFINFRHMSRRSCDDFASDSQRSPPLKLEPHGILTGIWSLGEVLRISEEILN